MGTSLSLLFSSRKRQRERDADDEGGESVESWTSPKPSSLTQAFLSLRYRSAPEDKVGTAVCRCVDHSAPTQRTYGCHAHLYETVTAEESHGVALAWCVEEDSPMSPLALLSLCRVANSCRKKTLLINPDGEALVLTYTSTL